MEARDDANVMGGTVRIRHYVRDDQISNDYDPAPDAYLTVRGERTYSVALGQTPSGDVVIYVESGDPGAVTVGGRGRHELTFTTGTWNTAQTVTMVAVHDGDLGNEAVTIFNVVDAGVSADDFDAAARVTFAVTVTDDDGLRVVPRTTTVAEGGRRGQKGAVRERSTRWG